MVLGTLVSKMAFLVIIITRDLTQVFIIFFNQHVTIVLSKKIVCINSGSWSKAWRSGSARGTFMTDYSIALIISMAFLRPVRSFRVLGVLRKLKSRLLRP